MVEKFNYSLLKYVHTDVTGDSMTIGILFWFESEQRLIFVPAPHLQKLCHYYGDSFSEESAASFLKSMADRCKDFEKTNKKVSDFEHVKCWMLMPDSTAMRFFGNYTSLQYTSIDKVVEDYYALIFKNYG